MQHFASDNYAGFCPESLKYFLEANGSGHEPAYGDDSWTQRVCDRIRDLFETDCEVFFVFNGTAANSLALSALCQSEVSARRSSRPPAWLRQPDPPCNTSPPTTTPASARNP
ncbi:beta-eliminating lyase-related protein [Ralstonia solanacearum]|uniref:beta-eliminating lyase-related protein n=1 Tax=Ralstonia solanacearum species complex bacterium KE101 TaxID=3119587 RepID=UPI0008FC75CA